MLSPVIIICYPYISARVVCSVSSCCFSFSRVRFCMFCYVVKCPSKTNILLMYHCRSRLIYCIRLNQVINLFRGILGFCPL